MSRSEKSSERLFLCSASTGESLLVGAGRVSHKQAQEKATAEYLKYQERTLSPVEQAYFNSIKVLAEKTSKKKK